MNFQLASRFSRNINAARSDEPMSDDQIRAVAPSIFAESAHASRSERYTYLPTIDVINGLRREGFQPFAVAQTRVRDSGKAEHTKHMIRLRYASNINDSEAKEVVLLNSHDGSSSYQMLAGMFRFVCANGMVCGETHSDIRVRHSGNIVDNVIEGATRVLDSFEEVTEQRDGMRALTLNEGEAQAFGRAALLLKYDDLAAPAPVTERQILNARRSADRGADLWTTFNVVQENLVRGGLIGRSKTGKRATTRGVNGIDQSVKLNRALWQLAEEMRRLKAAN
ncbi:hypothetical protein DBR42_01235 [Pelomonas sp. HMWF004]|nr:hypothetical protein DBR42_01235 [Pelomonas sp. HMWF004]